MDKRTKTLAFLLVGLIALWGGYNAFNGYIRDPIQSKQKSIDRADTSLRQLRDEQSRIVQTRRQLKDWTNRSLPPKEIDAQRLYKDWLTQLADVVGFDDLRVSAPRRDKKTVGRGAQKAVVYHAVQVKLEGKTTFSRLNRFLYYFHRTKLMHRINDLRVSSESNEGDPLLTVKVTAEALAFTEAKDRQRLFPETELAADATAGELRVASAEGFPKKGEFYVRVGNDLLTVTGRNGNLWKFRPGVDPATNDPEVPSLEKDVVDVHAKNTPVELTPLLPAGSSNLLTYYREVFGPGKSPFVLPVPPTVYTPQWSGLSDQRVARVDGLRMSVAAVDIDPNKGPVKYALSKSDLKDLKLDPKTGSIEWTPKKEDIAKTYSVELLAHQGGGKAPILKGTLRITLTDPNRAPVLELISDKSVMIGRTLKFQARATDPDEEDRRNLQYSLSGAPSGATIGMNTGEFAWTPTEADVAGDHTITVSVTDSRREDAQTHSRAIIVRLLEDATRFVNLIAILTDDGDRQAWLYDHSTKTKTVVREGRPFKVAGISGFVFVIGNRFIEYRADGETWRIESGRTLASRQRVSAPVRRTVAEKKPAAKRRTPAVAKRPATKTDVAKKTSGDDSDTVVKKPR